jgi:hypothetical protein
VKPQHASRRWTARVLLTLAWSLAGAWVVGRICNDRWLWSQFLYWMPSLPVALFTGAVGASCSFFWKQSKDRRLRSALWTIALAGAIAAYALIAEMHAERALMPRAPAAASDAGLRVLAWNPSRRRLPAMGGLLAGHELDLLLLANAPFDQPMDDLRTILGDSYHLARTWRLTVASRHPIIRWGVVPLGIEGSRPRFFRWSGGGSVIVDRGEAMIIELDTTATLGRVTTVWFVDLPSDPRIHRETMLRTARNALDNFAGPWFAASMPGFMVHRERPVPSQATAPAAPPDLIAGDCNTPRGSRSLRHLFAGTTDGFAAAGWGRSASYPAALPVLAIDHAAAGPFLACEAYELIDLGVGKHRAQSLVVRGKQ